MKRGDETRRLILDTGLELASVIGLESVSIGGLAHKTNLSKSGLFAHFNSKENLQIEILKHAEEEFTRSVLIPALKKPAGILRIKLVIDNWIRWGDQLTGGCIFVTAGIGFSDRPGKVRDFLIQQQNEWISSLKRLAVSAVKSGDFKPDIDTDQFAFELYALLLGFHFYHKLLGDPRTRSRQKKALDRLLTRYTTRETSFQ